MNARWSPADIRSATQLSDSASAVIDQLARKRATRRPATERSKTKAQAPGGAPLFEIPARGGRAGQSVRDTQTRHAGTATEIRSDAGALDLDGPDTRPSPVERAKTARKGRGRAGQKDPVTPPSRACPATETRGNALGGGDHLSNDVQTGIVDPAVTYDRNGKPCRWESGGADPAVVAEIREQWRRHQAWHRAAKSLTLQARAVCRRLAVDGDKAEADVIYDAALGLNDAVHPQSAVALLCILPLIEARTAVERPLADVEKVMSRLARKLPVWRWVEGVKGASAYTLAKVVGECGDVGAYRSPAGVWKRCGLAPHQGKAFSTWRTGGGLGADDWTDAGYSPRRRSTLFIVGQGLIGGFNRGPRLEPGQDVDLVPGLSDLQRVFVRRIRYEAERDPTHARPVSKTGKESFSKHAALRAQRYTEKRFLRLLWQAWRGGGDLEPSVDQLTYGAPTVEQESE